MAPGKSVKMALNTVLGREERVGESRGDPRGGQAAVGPGDAEPVALLVPRGGGQPADAWILRGCSLPCARMFTGLVTAVGTVAGSSVAGTGLDLDVRLGDLPGAFRIGDSIALSGVCCTVVALDSGTARFHLSPETLDRTWLGQAKPGRRLNLEGALRAGDPLGGHMVQGHVDGVGKVVQTIDPQQGGTFGVRVPDALRRYCVEKGSITLDGVSLTIAGIEGGVVRIWVIPHTAQVTTLGALQSGDPIHVEVDVIAKYVEQMLAARGLSK